MNRIFDNRQLPTPLSFAEIHAIRYQRYQREQQRQTGAHEKHNGRPEFWIPRPGISSVSESVLGAVVFYHDEYHDAEHDCAEDCRDGFGEDLQNAKVASPTLVFSLSETGVGFLCRWRGGEFEWDRCLYAGGLDERLRRRLYRMWELVIWDVC